MKKPGPGIDPLLQGPAPCEVWHDLSIDGNLIYGQGDVSLPLAAVSASAARRLPPSPCPTQCHVALWRWNRADAARSPWRHRQRRCNGCAR